MYSLTRCVLIALGLSFFFVTGCSNTTNVTGLWKKSDYTAQPFTSILVVALTGDTGSKFLWENKMATRLRNDGIKTVLTTPIAFPNDQEIDEKEIIEYVNKNNIEAVLVTRLVDTKTETVYYPPTGGYYGGQYGYYSRFNSYYSHAYTRTRGFANTKIIALLETNLYQSNNQELVWSMSSDTVEDDFVRSVRKMVDSASKKVLSNLKKEKLI